MASETELKCPLITPNQKSHQMLWFTDSVIISSHRAPECRATWFFCKFINSEVISVLFLPLIRATSVMLRTSEQWSICRCQNLLGQWSTILFYMCGLLSLCPPSPLHNATFIFASISPPVFPVKCPHFFSPLPASHKSVYLLCARLPLLLCCHGGFVRQLGFSMETWFRGQ